MFKNLSIKWKLATLVAILLVALAAIGGAGYSGIRGLGNAVTEIGKVRLPSIHGLLIASEGQTAVKSATLETAIYENNYKAQRDFADVLELRKKAWANIDAGFKIYEPLPQTKEEEALWKTFQTDWSDWKRMDDQINATIAALANTQDEVGQKALFVTYFKQFLDSRPRFNKAEASLNKIVELNNEVADESVKAGEAEIVSAQRNMLVMAVVSVLVSVALAIYITFTITSPLHQAVRVTNLLSEGDLTVRIDTTSKDETGLMLQALRNMVSKLSQVIEGQNHLVDAANRGNFESRIDLNGLQGFQKKMGEDLNKLVTVTGESINDVVRVMGALSEGDLTQKISKPYEGSFGVLKEYTNNTLAKLSQVVSEVNSGAQALASASEEVSATAQSLSQAAS